MRGTSNSNVRGNTRDRYARKLYLLRVYASDQPVVAGIQEPTVRCYRCGTLLTLETLTIDRIVPGKRGGRYRQNNIRPACGPCNILRGGE